MSCDDKWILRKLFIVNTYPTKANICALKKILEIKF